MNRELKIGITERGVLHTEAEPPYDLDTKFCMVMEAGVCDYFDKMPPAGQADEYVVAARSTNCQFFLGAIFVHWDAMKRCSKTISG
jgi:hypothetical protein